jgi:hypothetical protein
MGLVISVINYLNISYSVGNLNKNLAIIAFSLCDFCILNARKSVHWWGGGGI